MTIILNQLNFINSFIFYKQGNKPEQTSYSRKLISIPLDIVDINNKAINIIATLNQFLSNQFNIFYKLNNKTQKSHRPHLMEYRNWKSLKASSETTVLKSKWITKATQKATTKARDFINQFRLYVSTQARPTKNELKRCIGTEPTARSLAIGIFTNTPIAVSSPILSADPIKTIVSKIAKLKPIRRVDSKAGLLPNLKLLKNHIVKANLKASSTKASSKLSSIKNETILPTTADSSKKIPPKMKAFWYIWELFHLLIRYPIPNLGIVNIKSQ